MEPFKFGNGQVISLSYKRDFLTHTFVRNFSLMAAEANYLSITSFNAGLMGWNIQLGGIAETYVIMISVFQYHVTFRKIDFERNTDK